MCVHSGVGRWVVDSMGLQVVGAVLVGMAVMMVVKARACVCVGGGGGGGGEW